MGAFNTVYAEVQCPRCGASAEMAIDLYFGLRYQLTYHLGDTYCWSERKIPKDSRRPEGGNLDGEGYTECPICNKDFFLVVEVRSDTLERVRPDPDKKPYLP
jgi:hypothetical protein